MFQTGARTYQIGLKMATDVFDTEKMKVILAGELRNLVLETKSHAILMYALPEAVEHALKDWRFDDVVNRLQDECDKLTKEHYEDLPFVGFEHNQSIVVDFFRQYIWLQGKLLKWKQLESKFIEAGIEFSVPR
ncbi:MAG: hypothetical protein ABJA64_03370 [Candidatus Saccharibacteria bacterium]